MIVVFPNHTHQLLVTKMPPCPNKVKHLLNILWNQKTKMPPITYMELTFKKDMLQLTEKSCEIYCLTIYAYFMTRTQVINHKLHISEVSFPDQSFTI